MIGTFIPVYIEEKSNVVKDNKGSLEPMYTNCVSAVHIC